MLVTILLFNKKCVLTGTCEFSFQTIFQIIFFFKVVYKIVQSMFVFPKFLRLKKIDMNFFLRCVKQILNNCCLRGSIWIITITKCKYVVNENNLLYERSITPSSVLNFNKRPFRSLPFISLRLCIRTQHQWACLCPFTH